MGQPHVGYLLSNPLLLRLSFLGVSLKTPHFTTTFRIRLQTLALVLPRPRKAEPFFMPSLVHALGFNFLSEAQTFFSKKLVPESRHVSSETLPTNGGLIQCLQIQQQNSIEKRSSCHFYSIRYANIVKRSFQKVFTPELLDLCLYVFYVCFYQQSADFNSDTNSQTAM